MKFLKSISGFFLGEEARSQLVVVANIVSSVNRELGSSSFAMGEPQHMYALSSSPMQYIKEYTDENT